MAIDLTRISWFTGETARPFVLYASGFSAASATIQTAIYNPSIEGAAFVAACWAGVAALFHSKAWEEQKKTGQAADVKIAEAKVTALAEPQQVIVANNPDEPVPVEPR